jgi:hypothetical protein
MGSILHAEQHQKWTLFSPSSLMISKCANPRCSRLLMRMDGGRFFGFPTSARRIEHFWLCMDCSKHFTLKLKSGTVELATRDDRKTA